jgi:phosphate transport system protein
VTKELINFIKQNPENAEQAIMFMMIAKYFERIGDHAVNIGEWVEFGITGKHPPKD